MNASVVRNRWVMIYLTLGVHVQRELQYLVCVSVCLCVCLSVCLSVCVSVTQHLPFHVIICATNNTNLLSGGWRSKILSDLYILESDLPHTTWMGLNKPGRIEQVELTVICTLAWSLSSWGHVHVWTGKSLYLHTPIRGVNYIKRANCNYIDLLFVPLWFCLI